MSADTEISSGLVRGLWRHMSEQYGTRIITKQDALEMRVVGKVLERMGFLDERSFMRRFTTTLGRRIYVPFAIGETDGTVSPWDQIITCCHEHHHTWQFDFEGPLTFATKYVLSSRARAIYEAEAYRCTFELEYWRYGQVRSDPDEIAQRLRSYGCTQKDIDVAAARLHKSARWAGQGLTVNEVSRVARNWLDTYAGHLKVRAGEGAA